MSTYLRDTTLVDELALDPAADHVDDVRLLVRVELVPARDRVRALEAPAAAGRRRVLRDEDGVAAVGRLLAVLVRVRGREALRDDVGRVEAQRRRAAQLGEAAVAPAQVELRAERVPRDRVDALVDRGHAQRPTKRGARFSRNAATPSRKSSVAVASFCSRASSSSCSSTVLSAAAANSRFVSATARVGAAA